jgi:hypothetical protein
MGNDYTSEYKRIKAAIDLWVRRIYVIAFNIYAWYWPYRQIFFKHSSDFEEWLLWAFATFGMYYFVLDSKGIFLKNKKSI